MKPTALLLILPLAWTTLALAAPEPQSPVPAHVWRQSQQVDTARSLNFTRYTLMGKFLASPQDANANRPALVIDCIPGQQSSKGKFIAANLLVGNTLKVVYVEPEEIHGNSYFPKVSVRYRTDGAKKEEKAQWSPGTEKTSVSVPRESLKNIVRARTVAITADNDHGSQVAMQFDIPDPMLVEAGCDVD
jgi:hypothetical protein